MVIELKIDPEFQKLLKPQTPEEHKALYDSLDNYGFDPAFPIVIWHNIIIDGHNRYQISKELGIEDYTTIDKTKDFETRDHVQVWIIDRQIERRNISKGYRKYLIGKRKQLEKYASPGRPKFSTKHPISVENSTDSRIAAEIGQSPSSIKDAEKYTKTIQEAVKNLDISEAVLADMFDGSNKYSKEFSKMDEEKRRQMVEEAVKENKDMKKEIKKHKPPESAKEPERNEHGAVIALPEKVSMRVVQVKPESISAIELLPGERALHCGIDVDDKRESCYISLPKHINNFQYKFPYYKEVLINFHFELPNIENLILDFRNIFPSMTPIVSYLPTEGKCIYFNHSFSVEQWNNFVKDRCPQMIIKDELEEPEEPDKPKEEPEEPAKSKQKKEPEEPNPKEEPKKAKESKPELGEPKRDFTKDKEIMKQLLPTVGEFGISVQELIDSTGRREDYDKANDKGKHTIEGLYQKFMKSQGLVSKKIGKGYRYVKVERATETAYDLVIKAIANDGIRELELIELIHTIIPDALEKEIIETLETTGKIVRKITNDNILYYPSSATV